CFVELPVHGEGDLTVANLEHSELGGPDWTARRFIHDCPTFDARVPYRDLLAKKAFDGVKIAGTASFEPPAVVSVEVRGRITTRRSPFAGQPPPSLRTMRINASPSPALS
ncbi:MAG TPA: hypothetical protein VI094_21650, partial [Propionibacteriaceae bacterium]